ncbi:hypothetical protein SAMN05428959_106189 [Duganella sp. CF517]|uniref:hypothetical protein n=1 Tax=Duganella sp. CF517 TaxID=1881038 RepID=UPI0008B73854|nr:hypothetical protein [Duganella sp. CF517]SEO30280.1 hypothetical protein SAMN05428959_106189 [Duganella sp. CF517]
MKPFQSALLLSFCLALGASAPARAEAQLYFGTSSTYKSGFSSQKGNAARSRPSAPPANRQSGPGAFGKAPGSPASASPRNGPANASAASRDLDRSAAQARALNNLDARRAAAGRPTPLPPLNDTPMRPAPSTQPDAMAARNAATAPPGYPRQVIVQQPSGNSGLMSGVVGFMLGRAMSQANQPVSYPASSTSPTPPVPATYPSTAGSVPPPVPAINQAGQITGMPGLGDAPAANARTPAPPQPSFGARVLRWFAWLAVCSGIAWVAVLAVRKVRRLRAARQPHYSFERN